MLTRLKSINWKDVAVRAAKTFTQAFLACITIDGLFTVTDAEGFKRLLISTGISALSAGVSAVWNMLQGVLSTTIEAEEIGNE